MPTLSEQISTFALRSFHERDEPTSAGQPVASDLTAAERASVKADVAHIMSLLAEHRSISDPLAKFLGFRGGAAEMNNGTSSESRVALSVAASTMSKRPANAGLSAPAPTQSWAMRRFS